MLLAVGATAQAQQPTSIPRIGFLITASPSTMSTWVEAFRQGLRELGYVEGKNILTEHRYAEGKLDRLPALADELVRFQVHIIVTAGSSSTRAAKRATATIPIVMAFDDDPVGSGFAASLARPGANITGSSTLSPEIRAKQLELLKEIVPKLSRVGVLGDVTRPGIPQALREINLAADALRVHIQFLEVRDPKDIETAFRAVSKEQADAVLVLPSPITFSHRRRVIAFAEQGRLPAMFSFPEFVEDGGLMSYGANIADLYRRAATYVDKILKGAKPADLPIEQPTKFELIINLRAAKQIGLTVPPTVLARADRVIHP
jgi:putative ABC transport system substrate-binding protein